MLAQISDQTVGTIVGERISRDAARVDAEGVYPADTLRSLGAAGAFAHHTGPRPDMAAAIRDISKISAACLSTGFCAWCQSALALYLDRSPNRALSERLLPDIATARILGGTGLSNPMKSFSGIEPLALTGTRVTGGYRLRGKLLWISNIEPGHLFAVVFAIDGNPPAMAVVSASAEGVTLHRGARFIALEGTATRTVTFRDVFVEDSDLIAQDASDFIPKIRQSFVALQLGMGFGLVNGTIAAMETDRKGRFLSRHSAVGPLDLQKRNATLRTRLDALLPDLGNAGTTAFHDLLALRRDTALLALDATRAETLQAGARGFLSGSPSNRRQREAQFVAIVTPSIKHISKDLVS